MWRVGEAIAPGSVKLMIFHPSRKKIWIVVGRDNEYWVEPELGFCTCKDFYFTTLSGGDECYHLNGVRNALQDNMLQIIKFEDREYVKYLQALAEDNIDLLGSR